MFYHKVLFGIQFQNHGTKKRAKKALIYQTLFSSYMELRTRFEIEPRFMMSKVIVIAAFNDVAESIHSLDQNNVMTTFHRMQTTDHNRRVSHAMIAQSIRERIANDVIRRDR